jgi:glycosyltransferase involved in cell wall biosynthesis
MKFAIVIPAYQAADTLPTVIEAWRAAAPQADGIWVIDDGSTDETADLAQRSGAKVIRLSRNSGRGAARGRGLGETEAPFIVMCDTAIVPDGEFVTRAQTWLAEPKVAAVFAHIVQPAPRTVTDRWRVRHLFKSDPPALNRRALLSTSLCLLRREAMEQVGGFDACLRSGEDADLGRRLLAAGWEVIADPGLQATSLTRESAHALLARYARWNSPDGIRGRAWLRQVSYAVRSMARDDLRARDPLAALLSLAAPFYQLRPR